MKNTITGLTVCYRTKALMEKAYNSFRRFYPDVNLIIVNNSEKTDPCTAYLKTIESDITKIIHIGANIGHGPGMHLGLRSIKTRYALIFDSDVEFLADVAKPMMERIKPNFFGIGKITHVDMNGDNNKPKYRNVKAKQYYNLYGKKSSDSIPYLHPFCELLNIEIYRKFKPYIDHGAPCLETMADIYGRGHSEKILINFPVDRFVYHRHRGTRNVIDYASYQNIYNSHNRRKKNARRIFMTSQIRNRKQR